MCSGNTAPQAPARYSFLTAVDTEVQCYDGAITQKPPDGTWCSTASWEIPPVAFVGAVTLVAGAAGLAADLRQRRFEHRCVRARGGQGGGTLSGAAPAEEQRSEAGVYT
ncbi:unnamed protein product [Prorocentrum cordatum]|uniref:IPTL-CTERM sorting domain-containing protein n=1 Tax=Prorocentrum cordatum TaxID=2364126 RepID=A0ABN9V9H7_9DINO|nr:unnamed protein product [Polarella glacialis]